MRLDEGIPPSLRDVKGAHREGVDSRRCEIFDNFSQVFSRRCGFGPHRVSDLKTHLRRLYFSLALESGWKWWNNFLALNREKFHLCRFCSLWRSAVKLVWLAEWAERTRSRTALDDRNRFLYLLYVLVRENSGAKWLQFFLFVLTRPSTRRYIVYHYHLIVRFLLGDCCLRCRTFASAKWRKRRRPVGLSSPWKTCGFFWKWSCIVNFQFVCLCTSFSVVGLQGCCCGDALLLTFQTGDLQKLSNALLSRCLLTSSTCEIKSLYIVLSYEPLSHLTRELRLDKATHGGLRFSLVLSSLWATNTRYEWLEIRITFV